MKVTFWYRDGDVRTVDLVGPLRVMEHPHGTMDILHDEGNGWDYWFNKDGSFDGTGISAEHTGELNQDEANALLQGLKEMHQGKIKPFEQIKKITN